MKLKQILLGCVAGLMCGYSGSAYALEEGAWWVGWNAFQDPVSAGVGFMAREWNRHTETVHYDVTNGYYNVQEKIGAFKEEGKCGESATGNSGCDTTTEEEGAELTAKAEQDAMALDQSTIKIIEQSESNGDIALKDVEEKTGNLIGNQKGDLFDKVRNNVRSYIFETDEDSINAGCTCNRGKGNQCSPNECAQTRQNLALFTASTASSSQSNVFLRDMDANQTKIDEAVAEINKTETIADFVGRTGKLSVLGSSFVADLMLMQAYDLRAQSYRNLAAAGVTEADLSKLKEEETK